jgi:tetratricopeptide (TPR) repeat protein
MNRALLIVCAAAITWSAALSERARAQLVSEPAENADATTVPTSPPVDQEAVRLYNDGVRDFDRGDYDRAIDHLKASYLRARVPALLYNLGQAFRLKGDCSEALSFYRRYLATDPPLQQSARTRARIADMETCVAPASAASLPVTPPKPAEAPRAATFVGPMIGTAIVPIPTAPAPNHMTRRDRAGIAAGVAAVALASTSGFFAWRAAVASDDVSNNFVPGNRWDSAAQAAEHRGIWDDRLAIATGGAALLAAGLAAWWLAR